MIKSAAPQPLPVKTPVILRHSRLNPFIAILSAVLIYFLAQIIALNLLAMYRLAQGFSENEILTWLSTGLIGPFLSHLAVAVVGIGLVYGTLKLLRTSWVEIGFKKPKPGDVLYALVGYGWYLLLYFAAAFVVSILLPAVDFEQEQQLGFSTAASGGALLLIFVSLVILPPLYEEILTRGLLFSGLRRRLSLPVTATITSLLFAVAHLQWGGNAPLLWVAAIDTFVLSLVLVYLREKTGSLWPAIGVHAIKNLVAFMLLFVFKIQ